MPLYKTPCRHYLRGSTSACGEFDRLEECRTCGERIQNLHIVAPCSAVLGYRFAFALYQPPSSTSVTPIKSEVHQLNRGKNKEMTEAVFRLEIHRAKKCQMIDASGKETFHFGFVAEGVQRNEISLFVPS
jgi:hypothetical protein